MATPIVDTIGCVVGIVIGLCIGLLVWSLVPKTADNWIRHVAQCVSEIELADEAGE